MRYIWDRAVVINRADRADRLASFMASTLNSKHLGTVCRFEAMMPSTLAYPKWYEGHLQSPARQASYWCCRESHLRVWSQAIIDNVKHLLVFEDDAAIPDDFDAKTEAFFEELPDGWYGYQLGGFRWGGADRVGNNCGRMKGCGGLHAYGLSASGIQRAYDHVTWHRPNCIDFATASLQKEEPRFYCPKKFFVAQRENFSDNYQALAGASGLDLTF